ncbi:glycosyltransferase family 39 protein [Methanobrevibacter sp.]|uniref:glycosyltransferase family 39 protein n=1 Tax=Methanobrevibacter sp. TaxID=66852 RepID=UPI00388EC870
MDINVKDKKELILITLISAALVAYYINFNDNLGIYCSDVYVYLLNALYYAGTDIYSEKSIYLSPIICFLTSLIFDLGYVDKTAIFITTGILAIIGNIGLYLLLRLRFNNLLSLTGTIVYATLALNLTWLANGSLDIPAVTFTIWLVYFTLLAIDKNPKYYVAVFPLFVIGFFTRYTVGLILPPLFLYYIYQNSFKIKIKDLKYILIGIALAAVLSAIIMSTIMSMGDGKLVFDGLLTSGVEGNLGSTHDNAYNPDLGYYLTNMGNFISSSNTTFVVRTPSLNQPTLLSGFVFLILIVGAALWVKRNKFDLTMSKIVGMILCIIALATFDLFSSTITILLTIIGLYLIGRQSKYKMGIFMLAWILSYFIFQSYYIIKVNRYIIPIFPALVYFIMVAVDEINTKIDRKSILPIILIALFLIQGFAFAYTFEDTNEFNAPEKMTDYIKENVDNWSEIKIGNYNIRPYYWYLGMNSPGIESSNTQKIIDSNVTYYISDIEQKNLTNYTEIKQIDNLYLYKKNT